MKPADLNGIVECSPALGLRVTQNRIVCQGAPQGTAHHPSAYPQAGRIRQWRLRPTTPLRNALAAGRAGRHPHPPIRGSGQSSASKGGSALTGTSRHRPGGCRSSADECRGEFVCTAQLLGSAEPQYAVASHANHPHAEDSSSREAAADAVRQSEFGHRSVERVTERTAGPRSRSEAQGRQRPRLAPVHPTRPAPESGGAKFAERVVQRGLCGQTLHTATLRITAGSTVAGLVSRFLGLHCPSRAHGIRDAMMVVKSARRDSCR